MLLPKKANLKTIVEKEVGQTALRHNPVLAKTWSTGLAVCNKAIAIIKNISKKMKML